jgi:hypothetical protein
LIQLGNSKVAFQSKTNGKYVCAESAGAQPLIANRDAIGPWETFTLVPLNNSIALRSEANGRYVCSETNGADSLIANRAAVRIWETFQIIYI